MIQIQQTQARVPDLFHPAWRGRDRLAGRRRQIHSGQRHPQRQGIGKRFEGVVTISKTKTRVWDPAEHLITDEDMAAYLEAALQEGDSALIAAALGDIARAKGMSQIARDAGLGRESLYKALSAEGNPEFATIMKVIAALGLQLHASPSSTAA